MIYEQLLNYDAAQRGLKTGPRRPRHPDWPEVSRAFLYGKTCAICGGRYRLVAHHIEAFSDKPELELVESNLLPLCEGRPSANCHITWGHLGSWTLINPMVIDMCREYSFRFAQARMN